MQPKTLTFVFVNITYLYTPVGYNPQEFCIKHSVTYLFFTQKEDYLLQKKYKIYCLLLLSEKICSNQTITKSLIPLQATSQKNKKD